MVRRRRPRRCSGVLPPRLPGHPACRVERARRSRRRGDPAGRREPAGLRRAPPPPDRRTVASPTTSSHSRTSWGSTPSGCSGCRSAALSPWPARPTTPTGYGPPPSWPRRARHPRMDPPCTRDDLDAAGVAWYAALADGRVEDRVEAVRPGFVSYRSEVAPEDPDDVALAARWMSALPAEDRMLLAGRTPADLAGDAREALLVPDGYLSDAALVVRPVALRRRRDPLPGDSLVRRSRRQHASTQRPLAGRPPAERDPAPAARARPSREPAAVVGRGPRSAAPTA